MLICDQLVMGQGDFRLRCDAQFAAGQVTALIGPSGAGKSTLLSVIAGYLPPLSGRLLWQQNDLTLLPPGQRPVAMLFQDHNLFAHLTAFDNIALGLRPDLRLDTAQRDLVQDVLADVGLPDLGNRKPAALSGGQQSRVALARLLIMDRPIVLLDEPFAALGPALRHRMLDMVRRKLADQGRAVIMVTHDPADARRIADHVAVVADGHVQPPIDTGMLFADPPDALRRYLGGIDRPE